MMLVSLVVADVRALWHGLLKINDWRDVVFIPVDHLGATLAIARVTGVI